LLLALAGPRRKFPRMVRALRWLGIVALLAAPVVAWLGRPVQRGCEPPVHGPCDVYYVSASWDMPATIALIALGIGLLVVAWLVERTRADAD